ncbi:MAG: Gfo/Idh/MocA family protein [Chthoniobacterales bacterium]
MPKDKVALGILGFGSMGRNYLNVLTKEPLENLEVTAVCDLKLPDEKQPGVEYFDDVDAFLTSGVCDAISIVTPHFSHTDFGIKALQAGLHVLVEKPISVHKADCERLLAAHTDKSQVFSAMFNLRMLDIYQKVKALLVSGELGEIQRISWTITDWFRTQAYYDSGSWRGTWKGEGGGVLVNQCPHQLDLWQWLFGMPEQVFANVGLGRHHKIEVEDAVTAILEYSNGCQGTFITSTGEAPGVDRLEIIGDKGLLIVGKDSIKFLKNSIPTSEAIRTVDRNSPAPEIEESEFTFSKPVPTHRKIFANFADAILNGTPLVAPAEEGINSVELANAMLLSGLQKRVVELPLAGSEFESEFKKLIC